MEQTFTLIRKWAEERNLVKGSDPKSQFAKLISEFGEMGSHFAEYYSGYPSVGSHLLEKIKDDIGDQVVVMTILCAQLGVKIEDIPSDSLPKETPFLSLSASYGKLGDAILKSDTESFTAMIFSALSYLSLISHQSGLSFSEAVDSAYQEIKDRKGVMYHGAFVKESDERYSDILLKIEQEKL